MDLENRKVVFLGDSITEGVGASCEERGYTSVFGRKSGAAVAVDGIGGTRIAKQSRPGEYEPSDRYFGSRVGNVDPAADVVVVFGGTNDFGHGDAEFGTFGDTDESTFCGAVRCLLEKLISRCPSARIVLMTPLHRLSENEPVNEIGIKRPLLSEYVRAEKEIAAEYSVPVLDLWSMSGIQPRIPAQCGRFTADGLHPNDAGHERIADLLIGFLKTI